MKSVATALVFIYAGVGAALAILSATLDHIDPALKLTFKDYISGMLVAIGGLSVGRGILAHAKRTAS